MIGQEEKKAVIDLFPFLGDNPVVFDIGSNKGHWADIILDEFGDRCKMYLFEPNQKLLSFTEIKYEYKTNIDYTNLAAYKTNGRKTFSYFENYNNELSSLYSGEEAWNGLPVKHSIVDTIRIDTFCSNVGVEKIDYLKIDCEGSDVDVLIGCRVLLENGAIKIIQIEYSEHYKRGNHTILDVFDIAWKFGYKVYEYIENNFWEITSIAREFKYDNYYLTKEEIHNYSIGGWNHEFIKSTRGLDKFDFALEIGAFEGLTTKYMCENLLNDGGRILVVDPLLDVYHEADNGEHPYFKQQYERFLRNTRGLPVELKRGKSQDELPKLHAFRFDFVFVDGDHRRQTVYHDCVWAMAITKVGGHILIDDVNVWREETKEAVYKFLQEFGSNLEIIEEGYQVLVRKKGNQYNDLTIEYYR